MKQISSLLSTLPARSRRLVTGFQAWVALCALLLLWLLSAPEHTKFNRRLGVLLVTLLFLVAALALARSSRRRDLPPAFRKGLHGIALGLCLVGFGGLYVLVDAYLDPDSKAAFNLSDLLFLSSYPVILAGLFRMPRVERLSISVGRLLVDSAVFIVGVGLPLWFFAVMPGLASSSGYGAAMVVAYPLVTFVGISLLNIVLLPRMPLPSQRAFRLLVAAVGVCWLADLLYLLDGVYGFVESGQVNWANVLNTVSISLFLLAAGRIGADRLARPQSAQPSASSPLPVTTIVVVSVWLLVFAVRGHPAPDVMERILVCLGLLFVILSAREAYVLRDSARWLASEVERESRERFEVLVRHSSDVIMVVDAARTIRFASPAVASALGIPADEVVGRPLLELAHADDLARGGQFLDRVLGAPGTPQTVQWRLRHADGTYRNFETVGSNAVNESAVEGLVINLRDVTDRDALEERLRQAQKLEAIGQLVGGIAHNFNNILTSTMMRLSFLKEKRSLPSEVVQEVLALDKEARRSADLTKKLVMFGQRQFLRKEPMDLRETVARMQPEIAKLLGKGIQLYMTGGSAPQWVEADPELIEQMILAVCANARDAMPAGGCLIIEVTDLDGASLARDPNGGVRPPAAVRLSFQDTGCGMDSSVRQRLFEPFFTTKGIDGGGLGLGLAAVHGIVKQHRGWMEVESTPGLGSTFRAFFPKAPAPAAA